MGTAVAVLALPSTAGAAGTWGCEASAVRGTVATSPPIEPIAARNGARTCTTQTAGGVTGLPSPLTANALYAQTTVDDPAAPAEKQTVGASAGVADIGIAMPASALPDPDLSQLPQELQNAVNQLLAQGAPQLLGVRVADANVSGRCVGGQPSLAGSSRVVGLTVLGRELPTDRVLTQVINLDSENLSLAPLLGTLGLTIPGLPTSVQIPAQAFTVKITPNAQTVADGRLTQRALGVQITLGGQKILDLSLGEASVTSAALTCQESGATQAALQCTARKLVLADVIPAGKRVKLLGYADPTLVGKRVNIRFSATGERVAQPMVAPDGTFRATAPMPPRSIRFTNRARYIAVYGKEKSLRLKLMRRMLVREVRVGTTHVRIVGRVVRPLSEPLRRIALKRRISCSESKVVKRFRPRADGTFNVLIAKPPVQQAGVYRMETRVRKNTNNPRLYPTFTLPRFVELRRQDS